MDVNDADNEVEDEEKTSGPPPVSPLPEPQPMDVDQANNEVEDEERILSPPVTPPPEPRPTTSLASRHQDELLKEAAVLLKPQSYTESLLDSQEALIVLATLVELSQDECKAYLELGHDEKVKDS
jgi:hypothetical protein